MLQLSRIYTQHLLFKELNRCSNKAQWNHPLAPGLAKLYLFQRRTEQYDFEYTIIAWIVWLKKEFTHSVDILDTLGKAKYFATLDLSVGYRQVQLDPEL